LFSSNIEVTLFASEIIHSHPLLNHSHISNRAHNFSHFNFTKATSSFVSVLNLFKHTTTGREYFFIFSICLSRLQKPFSSAVVFSIAESSFLIQELYFIDFIVATITIKSGFMSQILHFISKNFSAHKSEPNHASVTV
jgi:hypothetical protein